MSIKIIEGKILCSKCGRLMDRGEPFKLNEFEYEIACLECDETYGFSKHNYVNFNTPLKQKFLEEITSAIRNKKSLSIDMTEARKDLIKNLSKKSKT